MCVSVYVCVNEIESGGEGARKAGERSGERDKTQLADTT